MHRTTSNAAAEYDDCNQRLMDMSDPLTYDDFIDEVDDIEGRLDRLVDSILMLKGQIESLKRLRYFPNHS